MNIALWIVQGLLAALFLLAGFMKAIMPAANLNKGERGVPCVYAWGGSTAAFA